MIFVRIGKHIVAYASLFLWYFFTEENSDDMLCDRYPIERNTVEREKENTLSVICEADITYFCHIRSFFILFLY